MVIGGGLLMLVFNFLVPYTFSIYLLRRSVYQPFFLFACASETITKGEKGGGIIVESCSFFATTFGFNLVEDQGKTEAALSPKVIGNNACYLYLEQCFC